MGNNIGLNSYTGVYETDSMVIFIVIIYMCLLPALCNHSYSVALKYVTLTESQKISPFELFNEGIKA